MLFASMFPGIPGPPGAYALVGMGAVFAGATHASMTAVLVIFEMTGDYEIILPLMLAVVTSTLLSGVLLRGESIYSLKLTRRGIRLVRGRALDVLEHVQVREVMSESITVRPETPLEGLDAFFLKANRNAVTVVDDHERLVGIVSLTDLRRAQDSRDDLQGVCVRDVMTSSLVTAFPDESLNAVLQRMAPRDLSRLPVVARDTNWVWPAVVAMNRRFPIGRARAGTSTSSKSNCRSTHATWAGRFRSWGPTCRRTRSWYRSAALTAGLCCRTATRSCVPETASWSTRGKST
jgi:CBS-domain-containing membrane protein